METEPFYPVGMQDFDEIREQNAVYVDKTEFIYKMAHGPKHVFLSRPRRFGKSLLTSTLQCYFEGRKELFTGLAIERLETEWVKHPVLHFDLVGTKGKLAQDVNDELNRQLDAYERIYGAGTNETSVGKRLSGMIYRAFAKTGQKVVLLIDEYDGPMLESLQRSEVLEDIRTIMRDFYSRIKQNGSYLRFVFLTGISTFSQLGMFSELNNLLDITNLDEYASICGITAQELTDNFQPGIRKMAKKWNCTDDEVVSKLREQYDGYHFTKIMVDIFNPYSLLNVFYGNELGDYWFKTGTPTFVIEMLKEHKGQWKFDIEEIDNLEPTVLSTFNTPLEQARGPLPFLYQAGYLTIKDYHAEDDLYVLGVPNTEVRLGLIRNLIPLYSAMDPDESLTVARKMSGALCRGDYDKALSLAQSFLAGVPFMDGDRKILADQELCEAYYHRLLFIIFSMLHNGARAQVRQAVGMPDIVVVTSQYIYIIEIKLDATPEVALQQIEEKQYAVPYLKEGKKIVKLGVAFS
jgi:hypothetical protein